VGRIHFRLKKTRWAALLMAVFFLVSCNWAFRNTLHGSGIIIEETRQLSLFHTIDMAISADLVFTPDTPQSFRIVGDDNILKIIETRVSGDGTLEIYTDKNYRTDYGIKIYVSMQEVRGFKISGSGTILGQGPFTTNGLSLEISGSGTMEMTVSAGQITSRISGSGTITLDGNSNSHTVDISGSGTLQALELDVDSCDITISGSGSGFISVRISLNVVISGSGSVYYSGFPTLNVQISGSGQLIKLD
jgi:hypothetical protein